MAAYCTSSTTFVSDELPDTACRAKVATRKTTGDAGAFDEENDLNGRHITFGCLFADMHDCLDCHQADAWGAPLSSAVHGESLNSGPYIDPIQDYEFANLRLSALYSN